MAPGWQKTPLRLTLRTSLGHSSRHPPLLGHSSCLGLVCSALLSHWLWTRPLLSLLGTVNQSDLRTCLHSSSFNRVKTGPCRKLDSPASWAPQTYSWCEWRGEQASYSPVKVLSRTQKHCFRELRVHCGNIKSWKQPKCWPKGQWERNCSMDNQ